MFVHRVSREGADEIRLGTVGKWEGFGESVKWFCAYWTLWVAFLLLITLTDYTVKEPSWISQCNNVICSVALMHKITCKEHKTVNVKSLMSHGHR